MKMGSIVSAVVACGMAIFANSAVAQSYPDRPVTIMVGYAPGGSSDTIARLIAPHMSEYLGQPVVVENRPGANGAVAAGLVANSEPDGHTLGLAGLSIVMNALTKKDVGYSLDQFSNVAMLISYSSVMVVPSELPVESVAEFQEYAQENEGEVNCGSGGVGSSPHMACILVADALDVDITHITYGGMAPALNDLMAGRLQVVFNPIVQTKSFIEEGLVRALALTGAERNEALPEVPTFQELGYDIDFSVYTGMVVPADTPIEIQEQINEAIRAALSDPEVKATLENGGAATSQMTLAEYQEFTANQETFWADFVQENPLTEDQ